MCYQISRGLCYQISPVYVTSMFFGLASRDWRLLMKVHILRRFHFLKRRHVVSENVPPPQGIHTFLNFIDLTTASQQPLIKCTVKRQRVFFFVFWQALDEMGHGVSTLHSECLAALSSTWQLVLTVFFFFFFLLRSMILGSHVNV